MKDKSLNPDVRASIVTQLGQSKTVLKDLEARLKTSEHELYAVADKLPNLIDASTPTDGKPKLVRWINEKPTKTIPLSHRDIGEKLNLLDFITAAQVSGGSWYYLLNDGALLEQALIQYAISKARAHGFHMVVPPSIVKQSLVHACGFQPRDQGGEQQVYQLAGPNEGLSLTGTAEIPLAGLGLGRTFEKEALPVKYVGVSRSYRAEAGARGKDTKGLYRVHEFTKVELFVYSTPEQSTQLLEDLLQFQIEMIEELGLTAKVLDMPSNDLGAPAYKKYDIEAWMPGRGDFGEVTSSSNCTDYQSRRLGARFINRAGANQLDFVHTLNGTAVAVPRLIVAILENFYDEATESVAIPEVLRKYMDGKDRIVKC
ncbi:hypothetical protein BABINDRAFT_162871 [Babjeviella inositovora NRRL Y-12698]|uniref:serine--tRNA ligase n=1 Tax=Babjeviella inositovora NRRL Y-12698 TaxID=984486 RepID=A0A1E3QL60_9ASCO|nr:uncharacterized protein BABINDRAFT_162871 [Babjeviella inositovora NRRL Y-12698]ODQ78204.1 hypothetical protein BABINDRAFT_162871 [Babjeviella inositovora NRRL Y-12698]